MTAGSEVVYRMSPDWSEMRRLFGRNFITDTETPSRNWLEKYIHPDDRPRVLAAINEAIERRSNFELEHRVRRVDGSLGWTFSRAVPLLDECGEIVEWFGAASDITARKHAEEQLGKQLGLLTAITDSAADAIFVSDGEERVTLMNPAAERIFGWSREKLTGRKLHDAVHDRHPDGRPYPASECPFSRVFATGETLLGHEDVFFRKDGSPVQVACSNAPLVIEGQIAGSVLGPVLN